MQLNLFETTTNNVQIDTTLKSCSKCGEEKHLDLYNKKLSVSGVDIKQSYCKACQAEHGRDIKVIHKTAPPRPETCDCCCKATSTLILDHDHGTGKFRGWLCYRCNSGIGQLGDDMVGLEKAISYLRKHDER
tara:strand:+ start:138 stop:533 length:396 start_codon:yes stop_codon:yes gene_type:complete